MAFTPPMLAVASKKSIRDQIVDSGKIYLAEPKLDGIRVIVDKNSSGNLTIYSKTGKDISLKFPEIFEALYWGGFGDAPAGTILDGEIIVVKDEIVIPDMGGSYKSEDDNIVAPLTDFEGLQSIVNSLPARAKSITKSRGLRTRFCPFDALGIDGVNLTGLDTLTRVSSMQAMFRDFDVTDNNYVLELPITSSIRGDGEGSEVQKMYDAYTAAGGEGIILKNCSSKYYPGLRRANTWYKYKQVTTYDVVATGATAGEGKFDGTLGAIDFGVYNEHGDLVHVGSCSGMTDAERQHYWEKHNGGRLHGTVIEVKANGLVGSGTYRTPRHPQFVRERTDKAQTDCTIDQFKVD